MGLAVGVGASLSDMIYEGAAFRTMVDLCRDSGCLLSGCYRFNEGRGRLGLVVRRSALA